jgi:hypothetical protein
VGVQIRVHNELPMKVALNPKVVAILGALPEDDAREGRDLIRQLRAATNPVGRRVDKQPPRYEVSSSHKGVVIQYEVLAGVATVVGVVSTLRRALSTSSDHPAGEPASRS